MGTQEPPVRTGPAQRFRPRRARHRPVAVLMGTTGSVHPATYLRGSGDREVNAPEEEPPTLEQVLAQVTAALREGAVGTEVLARLGAVCTRLLPVDGVSISLGGSRRRETLYTSDELGARIQRVQYTLGEGPGVEALDSRRPVLVPDLATAPGSAWPVFAEQITDLPVGALFAFPLQHGAIVIGALELHRVAPGWLSSGEVATALYIVDIAVLALMGTRLDSIDGEWVAPLSHDRAQVHQATGMLISGLGVPAEQALSRLRAYAFAVGRLVEEVSDDLVAGRLTPADINH